MGGASEHPGACIAKFGGPPLPPPAGSTMPELVCVLWLLAVRTAAGAYSCGTLIQNHDCGSNAAVTSTYAPAYLTASACKSWCESRTHSSGTCCYLKGGDFCRLSSGTHSTAGSGGRYSASCSAHMHNPHGHTPHTHRPHSHRPHSHTPHSHSSPPPSPSPPPPTPSSPPPSPLSPPPMPPLRPSLGATDRSFATTASGITNGAPGK